MPGNDYLINGSTAEKEDFAALDRKVQETFANLQNLLKADTEKQLTNEIIKKYEEVKKTEEKILSLVNPVGTKLSRFNQGQAIQLPA